MVYKRFLCCGFILITTVVQAQHPLLMSSDRPGKTLTPVVTGKDYLLIQLGAEKGNLRQFRDWQGPSAIYSTERFVLRYGIGKRTELNFEFLTEQQTSLRSLNLPGGFMNYLDFNRRPQQADLGIRHMFFSEEEQDFTLAAIGLVVLGKETNAVGLSLPGAQTGLLGSKSINNKLLATANLVAQWNDPLTGNTYQYSFKMSYDLGKNLGLFAETMNLGSFDATSDHRQLLDGGFSWKLTPNFMFDFSGGWARMHTLNYKEDYFFGGFGVSWKIKARPSSTQRL